VNLGNTAGKHGSDHRVAVPNRFAVDILKGGQRLHPTRVFQVLRTQEPRFQQVVTHTESLETIYEGTNLAINLGVLPHEVQPP